MQSKLLRIANVLTLAFLIIPAFKLDLFTENYSTLTRTTIGYWHVMFLGAIISLLVWYESKVLGKGIYGLIIALGFLLPCLIGYDYDPGSLKANIHVFFAWSGFYLSFAGGLLNIFSFAFYNPGKSRLIVILAMAFGMVGAYGYFNWLCVNTLCELAFTIGILVTHWLMVEMTI